MISDDFLADIQKQMNEDFLNQNPKLFDTVFEIEGRNLYAHRYRLSVASTTFKSMLSSRWNSKDEAIPIKDYSFEDFKEFLTFIYSGKCKLSNTNVFVMIDLAEFYQIKHLKLFCDEYLSKMEINLYNIFKLQEISIKYFMPKIKALVHDYVTRNFVNLINSKGFLEADKCVVEEFVVNEATCYTVKEEELFQAVFQWAERQAMKKQKEPDYANSELNELIKTEITPFLPYFKFKRMDLNFLHSFVGKKDFLFSHDELQDILVNANSDVKVKVTNELGESIYGTFPRNFDAVEQIKSLRNRPSDNSIYNSIIYWVTKFKLPSTPSLLQRRHDEIEWYLIYFPDGDIGIVDQRFPTGYLLAEMTTEVGKSFTFTANCIIELE